MMAMIDTLKLSKRLHDSGLTDAQAEAIADSLNDALSDSVVTKKDLELAVSSLRNQIWSGVVAVVLALGIIQHFFK